MSKYYNMSDLMRDFDPAHKMLVEDLLHEDLDVPRPGTWHDVLVPGEVFVRVVWDAADRLLRCGAFEAPYGYHLPSELSNGDCNVVWSVNI